MIDLNKRNIKFLLALIIIILLVYFVNLISRISNNSKSINDVQTKITDVKKEINKERKNKRFIENKDEKYIKNAYFNKNEKYFEKYVRELLARYNITINSYQSTKNEKDYSEVEVIFNVNAFTFFKLLNDMEEGNKIIVIKKMALIKENMPNFKISMELGGYYKE
jgi:hypothetical protein